MIVIFHVPQSPFLVYMITCFLQQQEQEQQQHYLPETKKQIIKTDYENLSSRLRWIPNLWHSMKAVLLRFLSMELLCETLPTQSLTSSHSQTQLRTACKQPHMLLYTTASASPALRLNIGIILPHHPFLAMFPCNVFLQLNSLQCCWKKGVSLWSLVCMCVSLSPFEHDSRTFVLVRCVWVVVLSFLLTLLRPQTLALPVWYASLA
jgi:hypothetical protein